MNRTIKSCCSRWLRRAAALACGLLAALTAGCGAAEAEPRVLRVGVALYTQDDTFISTIAQELERMAREEEQTRGVRINLSVMDGRSNQTTQLDQIDSLIDRGCDALCVNIVDRTAAAVLIDKAQKAEVPVIFFNRQPVAEDMLRWEHAYYVGAKAEEGGILQGRLVLEAWQTDPTLDRNGDGVLQYVMLEGEPGHQDAMLRTEYAVKTLTDAGVAVEKLASDTANWKRGQAMAKAQQWLDEGLGGSVEVVFANNDDMALGAIDAFKQAGEELPLVVGVDATAPALEAVAAGELYGTVRNDGAGIARSMLDLVLALAEEQDPAEAVELEDGHYVWLPYRAVTARDLEEPAA